MNLQLVSLPERFTNMEEYQDLIEVIEKLNDDLEELEELLDVAKSS